MGSTKSTLLRACLEPPCCLEMRTRSHQCQSLCRLRYLETRPACTTQETTGILHLVDWSSGQTMEQRSCTTSSISKTLTAKARDQSLFRTLLIFVTAVWMCTQVQTSWMVFDRFKQLTQCTRARRRTRSKRLRCRSEMDLVRQ